MAGRIPQSFINDMLDRVDIVDMIESRMSLKKTGKNYSGLCPFHDEKTPSFSVSPDKQFFHCFGCQESGTALTFMMKYDRLEFVEAVEELAKQLGLEIPREAGVRTRPKVDQDLYTVLALAEQFYRSCLRDATNAISYLKKRGLTGEVARDFGIGYAPEGWQNLREHLSGATQQKLIDTGLSIKNDKGRVYDRFRDRIMFPIRDTRGRVIGFGGRTMQADDGPKYLNSPETEIFHKGDELYGLYEARRALRKIDSLIVVEGYMDVVALAQHGVANAVATLGTASGEAHFRKLYRYADEVICCFDGDQAGRNAAWKALENALPVLNEHRQLKLIFLPDGEDPDSLIREKGKSGFQRFVDNALPGLEFLFSRLSEGLDLESIDGQAKLSGLIGPYISRVPEGLLRQMLEQKLANVTGAPVRVNTPIDGNAEPLSMPLPDYDYEPDFDYEPSFDGEAHYEVSAPPPARIQGLDKVGERLLTYLLQEPGWWHDVDLELRGAVLEMSAELGLLGELMKYIDAHEDVDAEELLIVWSDHPGYANMLEKAQAASELDRAAQRQGFLDGVARLKTLYDKAQRRALLASLRAKPSDATLQEYMQLRGPGRSDSANQTAPAAAKQPSAAQISEEQNSASEGPANQGPDRVEEANRRDFHDQAGGEDGF